MDDTWGPLDLVWEWQHSVLGKVVEEWRPVVPVFVWVDDTWGPLDLVWEWQHSVLGKVVEEWRPVVPVFVWVDHTWGPLDLVWEWGLDSDVKLVGAVFVSVEEQIHVPIHTQGRGGGEGCGKEYIPTCYKDVYYYIFLLIASGRMIFVVTSPPIPPPHTHV